MKKIDYSSRLKKLPAYLFAQIDEEKNKLRRKGVKFLDLSIGDPDIPAPSRVIDTLCKSSRLKENQKYALDQGKQRLRQSIKSWMRKRFKVDIDAQKECLVLIGSKEGLVHFPLAFGEKGDRILIPSPGYPGYRGAVIFSLAQPYVVPLRERNSFLPRLDKIPLSVRNRAKIFYLNYPNNPTTTVAPREFLEEAARFCCKYGIILVYDNAYSEIYSEHKPLSILEVPSSWEIAIEFHSFSKSFCMTGLRLGWACGNSKLVQGLLKLKTNIDSGVFGAIQEAGITALEDCQNFTEKLRGIISRRKEIFLKYLRQTGIKAYSYGTFYIWAKIPSPFKSSVEFAKYLLKKANIISTPGVGFGRYGEGFIRFSLTTSEDEIEEAGRRLTKILS